MKKDEKEILKEDQIEIELDDAVAQGVYSNLAIINNSVSEFVLDFVTVMPGTPKARVNSRIILSPHHAKRLLMALHQNVSRYESSHGEITDIEKQENVSIPFFGTKGEA